MPESPLLPEELDALVDATITDPLLRQNTAAVLRQVLKHQNASFLNRLADGASGGNPPDYAALLLAINGKQTKVRGRVANEYKPGTPAQSLGNLEVILDYLFTHSSGSATSILYTIPAAIATRDTASLPDLGRPTVAITGTWSGQSDTTVYVEVLEADRFAPVGEWLDQQGNLIWCDIDLDAATAEPRLGTQLGRVVDQPQALALEANGSLGAGTYIVLDNWNGAPGGVLLTPINVGAFGSIGYIYLSGKAIAVIADLASLTFELLAGGGGTPRDPYDVPTGKALQVIADYAAAGGPVVETDATWYGCIIIDDYTQPGDEFKLECSPSRPMSTGGATVWKWRRYHETGV